MKYYIKIFRQINSKNYLQLIKKLLRKVSSYIKYFFFNPKRKAFETHNAIVIFSEARGGSTWVMEQIQNISGAVTIFEPLWGKNGKFKKIAKNYSSPFYLGADGTENELKNFLNDTLQGKQTSWRTLQFNSFKKIISPSELLCVKMVNVNLIAKWFVSSFNLKAKPIYVVRHPLAILVSRERYNYLNEGNVIDSKVTPFDWNRIKTNKHPYFKYKKEIEMTTTKFELFLTEWCIRNKYFLGDNDQTDFIIVYYEDFVLNPDKIIFKISKQLGLKDNFIKEGFVNKSGTTSLNEQIMDGEEQLSKWMKYFDQNQLANFQRIFNLFDIKEYDAFSAIPKHLNIKE